MDFYKRVGIVCNAIPEGRAASYGQIALLCGKPRNARQVGYCLNRGRAGKVPAHRVVNSQGYLTGAGSFEHPDTEPAEHLHRAPGGHERGDANLHPRISAAHPPQPGAPPAGRVV